MPPVSDALSRMRDRNPSFKKASKRSALDLSDLPVFAERRESLSQRLSRIAPGLLSLFIYAGLTWLAVIRLFSRYDIVR